MVTFENFFVEDRLVQVIWEGTSGNDVIRARPGVLNLIYGRAGDDVLLAPTGRGSVIELHGGEGNDTLRGGLGQDYLSGGPGADVLIGGRGINIYDVDHPDDIVIEKLAWSAGEAQSIDSVWSSVDWSLVGTAVEVLLLRGDATVGTGNALPNFIFGNANDNILDGGRNVDTLNGGRGDDLYLLRTPGDTIRGESERGGRLSEEFGHDTVWAFGSFFIGNGVEDIILQDVIGKTGSLVSGMTAIGNALDNVVTGNATANNLNGGIGRDTLTGGGGADDFIFSTDPAERSGFGSANVDTITDFTSGEDRIVLLGRLFDGLEAGQGANTVTFGTAANGVEERLIFDGTTLLYDADGSGDAAQIAIAVLEGDVALTADDIFVT